MGVDRFYKWIEILAVLGIVLAIYLLFEQFTQSSFKPCNINSTVNCEAIISGAVSKTLGVPTPLYGLIGYILIFFAAILRKNKTMLGVSVFGLLFCLWIAFQELFLLHVICPVCIICQVTMITVFSLSLLVYKKS